MLVRARRAGKITYVDAERIEIGGDVYPPAQVRRPQRTHLPEPEADRPAWPEGRKGRGASPTAPRRTAANWRSGRNVLVAFQSWDGFNFEDAIIISEELVQDDTYTSIHIEEFDIEIRETKLGREEFTRDIPNVSEKALRNLDETGIVRIGTYVRPGDILVGKVSPKSKTELTPEEKLLHAIFGRAGEDVKNDSLEVPSGVEGIVIDTQKFSRRMSLSEEERKAFEKELKRVETDGNQAIAKVIRRNGRPRSRAILERRSPTTTARPWSRTRTPNSWPKRPQMFNIDSIDIRSPDRKAEVERIHKTAVAGRRGRDRRARPPAQLDEARRRASQRRLADGQGLYRHQARDLGRRQDGGPPRQQGRDRQDSASGGHAVFGRWHAGPDSAQPAGRSQPYERGPDSRNAPRLGRGDARASRRLRRSSTGQTKREINDCLGDAGLPKNGKAQLYDGRTGEAFEQETTVGYIYMLKLHHLVDEKVHARSTGPYSLITQQPLGGKARFGGQRFGEMEVWALEAYGAAYILQELLTVKSDDVEGRTKIYESMVKGENTLEAGTPASFDVLTNEIRGLGPEHAACQAARVTP